MATVKKVYWVRFSQVGDIWEAQVRDGSRRPVELSEPQHEDIRSFIAVDGGIPEHHDRAATTLDTHTLVNYFEGEDPAHWHRITVETRGSASAPRPPSARLMAQVTKAFEGDYGVDEGTTWGRVARSTYKYTDCGASMGVQTLDGAWVHGESELGQIPLSTPILALSCSSIVEGVDQTCENHVIELAGHRSGSGVLRAWYAALKEVEDEARDIWNQTHGCGTCAAHWEGDDIPPVEDEDMNWGDTPVWADCPECGGDGVCI